MQFRVTHLAAEVFNMHTVMWEQRIVGQLIGPVGEQCVHILCTKLLLTLRPYLLPMLQTASA